MIEIDRGGEGVRLWDLRSNSCHWPLGALSEPAEFFCGAPTTTACSYCQEHRARAFVRPYAAARRDKLPSEVRREDKPRKTRG